MTIRKCLQSIAFHTLAVMISVIALVPFLWMISTSLKSSGALLAVPIQWIPEEPTLQAYVRLFSLTGILRSIVNSFIVTAGAVVFTLASSSLAAFAGQGRRVHAFHCLHDAAQPGSLHPPVPHNEQLGTCQQSHCDYNAVSVSGFRGFHAEAADDEHPRYLSGCRRNRRCRTSAFFHHGVPAHVQDCTRDACDNNLNECME